MRKVNRITAAITALFVLGALWIYPAKELNPIAK